MRREDRGMQILKGPRRIVPKILLGVLFLSAAAASAQISVFFTPEYFVWQEFVDGDKILEETGPRYVLGASYKTQSDERGFLFGAELKGYYGEMHYDGATQSGIPVTTTTQYYGGLGEVRAFYRAVAGKRYSFDVVGGLGVEGWRRAIWGEGGYIEEWLIGYGKLGVELDPKERGWLGNIGIKYPFYTDEVARLREVGFVDDVELHPGKQVSLYFEGGYRFTKSFSALAVFDSWWFDESDVERVGLAGFFQPESRNYVAGLKLQWTF